MAVPLMIATAVSGGISAYGAYQQGQSQKNMYNYQAQAALMQKEQTGKVAQANITSSQDQAARNATMLSRNQSIVAGSQRASTGAQGLGSSVTAADIAKDTFTKQQMDQMTLHYNANVKAWNITNQANAEEWGLGVQADQDKTAAKNASRAGTIGAVTSLLSTAAQVGTEGMMFGSLGTGSSLGAGYTPSSFGSGLFAGAY